MVKSVLQGSHAHTKTESATCATRTDRERHNGQEINKGPRIPAPGVSRAQEHPQSLRTIPRLVADQRFRFSGVTPQLTVMVGELIALVARAKRGPVPVVRRSAVPGWQLRRRSRRDSRHSDRGGQVSARLSSGHDHAGHILRGTPSGRSIAQSLPHWPQQ